MSFRLSRLFLPFLMVSVFVSCSRGERYEIEGKSPNDLTCEGKKVYLAIDLNAPLDSTIIHNGTFRFAGDVPEKAAEHITYLFAPPHYLLPIVLEKGKIIAEVEDYAGRGTPLNDALFHFEKQIDGVEEAHFNKLRKIASIQEVNESTLKAIDSLYVSLRKEKCAVAKSFLQAHPNDVVGIRAMLVIIRNISSIDQQDFIELVTPLGSIVRESEAVYQLLELYNNGVKTRQGGHYTDFTGIRSNGMSVNLSELIVKGHYTLIYFWSSWCKPCLKQSEDLLRLQEQYRDKPLDIVGVLIQDDHKNMSHVLKGLNVDWPQIVDVNGEAILRYNIGVIPEVILLDPYGFIVERNLRGDLPAQRLHEIFGSAEVEDSGHALKEKNLF